MALALYGVMRRTIILGIHDIGLLLALYLKYLENDSEGTKRSPQDTKFKSIILLIKINLMIPPNGHL
jgi:hypothetical protein